MVPTVGNVGGVLGVPAGSPPPPLPNPCSPLTWSRRKYPGVKRLGRIIMAWRGAAGSDPTGQQQGGPRHPAPNPKTPPPPSTPTMKRGLRLSPTRLPAPRSPRKGRHAPGKRRAAVSRDQRPLLPQAHTPGRGGDGH